MDVPTLKARFPEFATHPDSYVQSFIAAATLQVDPDMWLALTDEGIAWLACHRMCQTPWGQAAKLVAADGSTSYGRAYAELLASVAVGFVAL